MKYNGTTRGTLLTGGVALLIIVGVAVCTYLFLVGNQLAALLASNVLIVALLGLVFALLVHVSRRQSAASRSRRREHHKMQETLTKGVNAGGEDTGSSVESAIKRLEESQTHLHALTRKRIREKHNVTEATLSRARRSSYKHYAAIKDRIESVATATGKQAKRPLGGDPQESGAEHSRSNSDRAVLRAFLFEMLDAQARSTEHFRSPSVAASETKGVEKDA